MDKPINHDTQTGAMRDAIAVIIEEECQEGKVENYSDAADAIIDTLPDMLRADPSILRGMVPDLVWDGFVSGAYLIEIHKGGIADLWYFDAGMIEREEPDLLKGGYLSLVSLDDLKAAANAHNIATVLAAMGVK